MSVLMRLKNPSLPVFYKKNDCTQGIFTATWKVSVGSMNVM